jgi:heme-degrading monooxygenase HmoA
MTVILINPFEVSEGTDDEEFLRGWQRAADYMQQQPGFLSSRLHRALAPDARFRFINVAEWASPQDFQAAVASEQFREIAKGAGPGSPALYEVVRAVLSGIALRVVRPLPSPPTLPLTPAALDAGCFIVVLPLG